MAGLLLTMDKAAAQTITAYDVAFNTAYNTAPPPNGLSPGGQNGGYGFGPWTFTVSGNGGAFISDSGPSGKSFDLWNTSAAGSVIGTRSFSSPLTPGQSFSVAMRLNSLGNASNTNAMTLLDANGVTLFSYYRVGGDNLDGHYKDALTENGAAIGFEYKYQQFCTFTFTLNSATTYTFTDNTTGASFSGVVSGAPITQVAFVRGNGSSFGNGQDFQFDNLIISTTGQVAPLQFAQMTPAPGSLSVAVTNPISVQVVPGGIPLKQGSVSLKVDGNSVTPNITTVLGVSTVSWQPVPPLTAGSMHTAEVVAQDESNASFTNTWTFTTGFPSLPLTIPGPFVVSNGNSITILTASGNGWLGTNYDANSSRTLFTRFSMTFRDMAGETGNGGAYGGLHFYQNDAEHLLIGNSWLRTTWSVDAASLGTEAGQIDLSPVTPIVLNEWHTMVVRTDFAPGGNALVKVWFDPDFSQTEANQQNPPLEFSADSTFNNIRLRCGNGTANAEFTNIVLSALGTGVGFAAPANPQFQGFVPGANVLYASPNSPVSVQVVQGGVAIKTSNITMSLDGNTVTPVFSVSGNVITVSYQPPVAFAPASGHVVSVSLTDNNGTPFFTSWGFTVDAYPTLPITLEQDFDVMGGDQTIFSSQNGWIDSQYGADSSKTLYARVRMMFLDMSGEPENGGRSSFGGLHFFQDNNERLLIGNSWVSTNWSADAKESGEPNLLPITPMVLNEYHTIVARIDFVPGFAQENVKIWLDPDFTKSEGSQPNAPVTVSMDNTFNNVRLRAGNGNTWARVSGITFAATAPDVGFAAELERPVLSIVKLNGNVQLSWTGAGILQQASAITGAWSNCENQTNPQTVATGGSAMFYRIKQ